MSDLRGRAVILASPTDAMTAQPRVITRERISGSVGVVDVAIMAEVDGWLRDFLALPRRG